MKINTILINNRYLIYNNGVIYDTLKAKDIPQKIFEIRDILHDKKYIK